VGGLASLGKLRADPLVEQAYQALREAIMSGKFTPGASLSIRALARTMGTSPMPIRDSMQRLAAEGALILAPTRTYCVPTLSRGDFEDVWTLRQIIEPLTAARAARSATATELTSCEAHFGRLEAALRNGSRDAILEENRLFHFNVYQSAHSKQLLNVIEILWLRSGPLLNLLLNMARPDNAARVQELQLNRRLIVAMRSRNPRAARAAAHTILRSSADWYRAHYEFA
jgi:DNA-binding GntR family transcriptional regulator